MLGAGKFFRQSKLTKLAGALALLLGAQNASAMSEWTYHKTDDGLHPNATEQQMVWLMNQARVNPMLEGRWLAATRNRQVAVGRDFFEVDTGLLRREFAAIAPAPPAAFDVRLFKAARIHALALIRRDSQDHIGQKPLLNRLGFNWQKYRGNVFSYAESGLNAHAAFNIDWGDGTPDGMQVDRGHRKAIMNEGANYTNVGYVALPERDIRTEVGRLVVVGNHASARFDNVTHYNRFIVGTVWRDKNGSGRYEPGEGVGGVLVRPNAGSYYAMTAVGGGYAIPIRGRKPIRVRFSGAGLPVKWLDLPADLSQSVLLDYMPPVE